MNKNIKNNLAKAITLKDKLLNFVRRNLFKTLGGLLVVLLVLIVTGNYLRSRQEQEEPPQPKPIEVETFKIGAVPRIKVLAKVEKENVVNIIAQTSGIVQRVYVREGNRVQAKKGALAYISTNYQGANITSLQRQLAQKQYNFTRDTYETQKELIQKRQEIAEKTGTNLGKLREISRESLDETRNLIDLNQEIVDYLNDSIEAIPATSSAQQESIFQLKQLKSSYQSALNQLRSGLRSAEYATSDDNPPAELANLQKETTLKQLKIQEKSLDLNKEVSYLQYRIAQISESLSYPVSFVTGMVEKVHVLPGQAVQPGMPLFTIKGDHETNQITALVSGKTARNISKLEKTYLLTDNQTVEILPEFISTEATNGTLYTVKYTLPKDTKINLTNNQYLELSLPIGYPETGAAVPFIPIDAVYQTNDSSFVFLAENNQAKVKEVKLGNVYGQFVTVTSGLEESDQLILNRNIVDGNSITLIN